MFRMDEQQLEALLENNPGLSISSRSGKTSSNRVNLCEDKAKGKGNKYNNSPVYVYRDEFVYDTSLNKQSRAEIKRMKDSLISAHGPVVMAFDSKKEYNRYLELRLLEKAGNIRQLKRQHPLVIQPAVKYHGERLQPITYCADFMYIRDGFTVVEDVKGYDEKKRKWITTQTFNIKWKLLKARYPEYLFEIY